MKNQIMPCTVPTWAVVMDGEEKFTIPVIGWYLCDDGGVSGLVCEYDCEAVKTETLDGFVKFIHQAIP